ncbi:hypothetical protein SAMN05660420_01569 [Desulfuromusa kysingii]|uniref:Glycosyltransferase 2-like domain-containing protein n=1 Tax=Desulfuromusa kysingii TaxID=37625 RepID=A0A1H3ZKL2_9BACT|nr:TIGR04283 family arsenosugar biosynthesis glycosyltransferase [Desulfuromusa kysingii]SEA24299.1 hypothetical protein SAMN05660420_01569 [Desulfuromusa kysingii]
MPLNTSSALLIFSKYPVLGKAKTRLIPALGAEGAAQLHRRLAEHTLKTARTTCAERCNCNLTVHYTGARLKDFRSWLGSDLEYKVQPDGDLGARMQAAFKTSFDHHHNYVIGLGTDVPGLTPELIQHAYTCLGDYDIVIGPALDGGYYLLGMKSPRPELFAHIDWGTDQVYRQTREICTRLELSVYELPHLSDIDLPEDLPLFSDNPQFNAIIDNESPLSIIIPTLNEAAVIATTIESLQQTDAAIEIIVVDAASEDDTAAIAAQCGAKVFTVTTGRADQLNAGVKNSNGRHLLFLHADTLLVPNYRQLVRSTLDNPSTVAGAFRFKTDASGLAMRTVEWGTNFRSTVFKWPYGDQGLFMERRIFDEMGGFSPLTIMEDFDLVRRLRQRGPVVTLKEEALTSARRWKNLGVIRTTIINQLMIAGFFTGVSTKKLRNFYRHK